MDNWKTVNKIAKIFGYIFVVFSVLVAIVNYELVTIMYSSPPPASFIVLNILTATVPLIISAVLSFTVAIVTTKSSEPTEKVSEPQTEPNGDSEETQP
jgi:hypothetical protein